MSSSVCLVGFQAAASCCATLRPSSASAGSSKIRPEYKTGTVDNEKSTRPKASRDVSKSGQLVGVGLWSAPESSLPDQLKHRLRSRKQQCPGQHVRERGLHIGGQIPAHENQCDCAPHNQHGSKKLRICGRSNASKITKSQSKPRLYPAINRPTAPSPTTAGPR